MSIVLLRSFVEVYRQGSVSKAASELGLTQPAVSGHVASLEAMMERKLFTRHARGVRPTVIADELADRVSDAIDTAENVLAEAKARSSTETGVIHLCGPSDILSDLLTSRIKLLASHNFSVNLHPATGNDVVQYLIEGRSDFAFAVTVPQDARIDSACCGSEEMVLVASPELFGPMDEYASLEDALIANPLVIYDLENYTVHEWLDHNGIDIKGAKEVATAPDLRGLCNLVEKGLGWSVLPRYLVSSRLESEVLVEIGGPIGNPATEIFMLWLKSAMRAPRTARAKSLLLQDAGEAIS